MDLGKSIIKEIEGVEPNKEILAIIREVQRQNMLILETLTITQLYIKDSGKPEKFGDPPNK